MRRQKSNTHLMSASYPPDAENKELRKVLRIMALNSHQVETTVEIDKQERCYRKELGKVFNILSTLFWSDFDEKDLLDTPDSDEVDGRTEDILKNVTKLHFLKIIFIDIGVSLGDVITDFIQGTNLIFDDNWNILWLTFHYGLLVVIITWIPIIPILIHYSSFKNENQLQKEETMIVKVIKWLCYIAFFPIIPTVRYMKLLFIKKQFKSNHQKMVFLNYEKETNELKSMTGAVESPLQFVLLLWLMMRGILKVPWNQELSSSCVEDSLGRVACIPSIPILSMIFSFCSIMKSLYDLNLAPVMSSQINGILKTKLLVNEILCSFPFYFASVSFRLVSFAFIITYIDYWSAIPGIFIFILMVSLFGLFLIKNNSSAEEIPLDNVTELENNPAFEDDKVASTSADPSDLIWDGREWISESMCKPNIKDEVVVKEEEKEISFDVNETSCPLFFNALASFIFPVVYLPNVTSKENLNSIKDIKCLQTWQSKLIFFEVLIINSCILINLFVIGILVAFVDSFNYRYNIMSFFWFTFLLMALLLFGILTLLWSFCIYPTNFSIDIKSPDEQNSNICEKKGNERRRHLTGNSYTESVTSANNSILKDNIKFNQLSLKLIFSSTLIIISLMPIFGGMIVYKLDPVADIFLLTVQKNAQGIEINAAKSLYQFGFQSQNFFAEVVLAQNDTETIKFKRKGGTDTFFMNIDSTKQENWRVSSPVEVKLIKHPSIYVRHTDISKMDIFGQDIIVFLTYDINEVLKIIHKTFDCSTKSLIYSELFQSNRQPNMKILHRNGTLLEYVDLHLNCYSNGFNCDEISFKNDLFPLQCSNILLEDNPSFYSSDGKQQKLKPIQFINSDTNDYCCKNGSHVVQFFGDDCEPNLLFECNFSEAFKIGKCDKFYSINHSSLCLKENCFITLSYRTTCDNSIIPISKCNPMFQCL